jgi:hypothetical protein
MANAAKQHFSNTRDQLSSSQDSLSSESAKYISATRTLKDNIENLEQGTSYDNKNLKTKAAAKQHFSNTRDQLFNSQDSFSSESDKYISATTSSESLISLKDMET